VEIIAIDAFLKGCTDKKAAITAMDKNPATLDQALQFVKSAIANQKVMSFTIAFVSSKPSSVFFSLFSNLVICGLSLSVNFTALIVGSFSEFTSSTSSEIMNVSDVGNWGILHEIVLINREIYHFIGTGQGHHHQGES
jgi:hypothetical protein